MHIQSEDESTRVETIDNITSTLKYEHYRKLSTNSRNTETNTNLTMMWKAQNLSKAMESKSHI